MTLEGVGHGPQGAFEDGWVAAAPVGSYRPNRFGLLDVHGNVSEWCADAPDGPDYRITRGGSFYHPARFARSAFRFRHAPTARFFNLGVRAVRQLP